MNETHNQRGDKRYHRVLRTIALNTGGKQPPGMEPRRIAEKLVSYGPLSRAQLDNILKDAQEENDIVVWIGPEGHRQVTLRSVPDLRELLEFADAELEWPDDKLDQLKAIVREMRDDGE